MKPKLEILLHRRHTFRSSIIHNFSCHTGRRLPCWWSSCRTGCARPLSPAPTPPATASVASSLWWCMAAHHPRRPRHRRRQLRLQARIGSRYPRQGDHHPARGGHGGQSRGPGQAGGGESPSPPISPHTRLSSSPSPLATCGSTSSLPLRLPPLSSVFVMFYYTSAGWHFFLMVCGHSSLSQLLFSFILTTRASEQQQGAAPSG